MLNNCIKNLLDLKELNIKSVKNFKNSVEIYAELPKSEHIFPCYGTFTSKVHDHYTQPIKDIPVQFKPTTILLRKTRYECKSCGKIFYPQNDFIAKYKRKSKRLVYFIINQLKNNIAASTIAKNVNIDAGFISKMLPYLSVTNTTLPRVLCIDEFKGNSGQYKYQVAYREKECLVDIIHSTESVETKKTMFSEWVKRNLESSVPQLVECTKTFQHWAYEIKNSLEVPYSNGPIEGTNNKSSKAYHFWYDQIRKL